MRYIQDYLRSLTVARRYPRSESSLEIAHHAIDMERECLEEHQLTRGDCHALTAYLHSTLEVLAFSTRF